MKTIVLKSNSYRVPKLVFQMDNSRKSNKKTTREQFELIIKEIEVDPELAKSTAMFGTNRNEYQSKWCKLSLKLNACGPPQRSVAEWKKVWADLKSRTKKKIRDGNSLDNYEALSFRNSLTGLERQTDKILGLSRSFNSATAGGLKKPVTPKESPMSVSSERHSPDEDEEVQSNHSSTEVRPSKRPRFRILLKEQLRLMQLEVKNQERTLVELKKISESSASRAASAKLQAEVAKQQADAVLAQAIATQTIASSMEQILQLLMQKNTS